MAQVWEKEHDHYEAEKKREESKAEFEAEQAFLKTLSLLRWVWRVACDYVLCVCV
jgi:hypothetical protein